MVRILNLSLRPLLALALLATLSACVAYPEGYYGGPAYYAPSATVVVPIAPRAWYGGGYGGGYGGWHGGHGGWR